MLRSRARNAAGWTEVVVAVVIVIYSESDDKTLVALMVVFEGLRVLAERGLEVLCSSHDEASSGRERRCCSVSHLCPTPCDPMDCRTSGFPVLHYLPEFAQTHVHWVGNAIQPFHPLLPSSLPAFNLSQHWVFSNELALCIRRPKYWSFSFIISPSNEYSGLISFRIVAWDPWGVRRTGVGSLWVGTQLGGAAERL